MTVTYGRVVIESKIILRMAQMFGPAQSYVYEDDGNTVIFKWVAGGPWDYYRKAGTASGGSEDPLTDSIWNLTELNGRSPLPTTTITAEFGKDGRVTGSSGCNNYTAAYEVDGNNINEILEASKGVDLIVNGLPPGFQCQSYGGGA